MPTDRELADLLTRWIERRDRLTDIIQKRMAGEFVSDLLALRIQPASPEEDDAQMGLEDE